MARLDEVKKLQKIAGILKESIQEAAQPAQLDYKKLADILMQAANQDMFDKSYIKPYLKAVQRIEKTLAAGPKAYDPRKLSNLVLAGDDFSTPEEYGLEGAKGPFKKIDNVMNYSYAVYEFEYPVLLRWFNNLAKTVQGF